MPRFTPVAFVVLCAALIACGEVEPKPNQPTPNIATNNTSVNNTSVNNTSVSCLVDSDCPAPDVCEAQQCVATCTSDASCLPDETCQPRLNGPGTTCQVDFGNNIMTSGCDAEQDPNAFCEAQFGDDAFCDAQSGDCVVGVSGSNIFIAQIQDVTRGADLCEGLRDPGSDIQGIELTDASGNTLGWGNLVGDDVILSGNSEANFRVIDGQPASVDFDGCVDSFSGNVLSLGCNGWIAVEFLDEFGDVVELREGFLISVYEYGAACSSGVGGDEYTVTTCSNIADISLGDDSSCTNVLGTAEGLATFTVNL